MFDPGAIVGGRYQIVRPLGRGGMGEVYEALQLQLGRRVALKTIRPDYAGEAEAMARFRREAESAAALGHPNLVQVTDFHDAPGEAPFLVMEMLDGATLASVLASEGRLAPGRAAFIGVQLLSGLAAAHRAGIVHRDVKPGNIFLQSTTAMRDLVKVLDFGVAKLVLDAAAGAKAMTHAGQVLGTLSYMAPEQATSGAAIDARTDIFGVGATLFHALAGVRPFDATEPGGGRTPLDRLAPWLNRDLAATIERALQRSPDARWSSAEEMATALAPFASGPGASAPPATPEGDTRRGAGGWDPAAVGRLEAPTFGGSAFGAPAYGATSGPSGMSQLTMRDHSTTGPDAAGRSGVSALAPAGAVPYAGPMGMASSSAPYPGPALAPPPVTHYMPAPLLAAPPRASRPWWLLLVAAVALCTLVPVVTSFVLVRRATTPDAIANNAERALLEGGSLPRCPPPDQCTQAREAHDLTYPLCTRKLPQRSAYRPGEMILAGEDSRIALVDSDLGGGRYLVRFLTGPDNATVADAQIAGRICRAGGRGERAGTAETVP